MKLIKTTSEYTIYQKRSGRYAVQGAKRAFVNGEDKAKILLAEGLIKLAEAKPKAETPAEEPAAEGDAAAE